MPYEREKQEKILLINPQKSDQMNCVCCCQGERTAAKVCMKRRKKDSVKMKMRCEMNEQHLIESHMFL